MRLPQVVRISLPCLLLVLLLGVTALSSAEYDKMFWFAKPGAVDPTGLRLRVINNALEVVTDQYTGWRVPWSNRVVDQTLLSGVYCTRVTQNTVKSPFEANPSDPNQVWGWGMEMKVGWSVSDSSCRLRDLKWLYPNGSSEPILNPTDSGAVPGGGELIWDPERGWVWRIWNDQVDSGAPIQLHGLELATFEEPLTTEELGQITEGGLFVAKAALVDEMIANLRAEVAASGLNRGRIVSLTVKLALAALFKEAGDRAYAPPHLNLKRALFLWGCAAQHMRTFIAECRSCGKGKPPRPPQEWITQAEAIIAALKELPGTEEPVVVPGGNGGGGVQALAAAEEGGGSIPPGGYIEIVLGAMSAGEAAVLHGDVTDSEGNTILQYADQVTIPAEMNPPTAAIDPEPEEGVLTDPGTVYLSGTDDTSVAFVHWAVGSGEEEGFEFSSDVPPVGIDFGGYDPGTYQLRFLAEDTSGNLSELREVTVGVSEGPAGVLSQVADYLYDGWSWDPEVVPPGWTDIVEAWVQHEGGDTVSFCMQLREAPPTAADTNLLYVWPLDIDQDPETGQTGHAAGQVGSERNVRIQYLSDPDHGDYGWHAFVDYMLEGEQYALEAPFSIEGNVIRVTVPLIGTLPDTEDQICPDGDFTWCGEANSNTGETTLSWDGAPADTTVPPPYCILP